MFTLNIQLFLNLISGKSPICPGITAHPMLCAQTIRYVVHLVFVRSCVHPYVLRYLTKCGNFAIFWCIFEQNVAILLVFWSQFLNRIQLWYMNKFAVTRTLYDVKPKSRVCNSYDQYLWCKLVIILLEYLDFSNNGRFCTVWKQRSEYKTTKNLMVASQKSPRKRQILMKITLELIFWFYKRVKTLTKVAGCCNIEYY